MIFIIRSKSLLIVFIQNTQTSAQRTLKAVKTPRKTDVGSMSPFQRATHGTPCLARLGFIVNTFALPIEKVLCVMATQAEENLCHDSFLITSMVISIRPPYNVAHAHSRFHHGWVMGDSWTWMVTGAVSK